MLLKSTQNVTQKAANVKNAAMKTVMLTAMSAACSIGVASSAQAQSIMTETVKVRFAKAALDSPDGIASVYELLETKASSACKVPGVNLAGHVISKSKCIENLMDQFVEGADAQPLTEVHMSASGNYTFIE